MGRMDFLHQLHNPEGLKQLIATGGYALLFFIIFAETGLLVGFFLPGDSLLFIAGTLAAVGHKTGLDLAILIPLLCVAAIAGDAVGYFLGRKVGPTLFAREDSRFFKRAHLQKTQAFYEKHGPKTIVMARFVPIVRTFAPTVAGAADMKYRTFVTYNVLGGIGWITSMLLLGFWLGKNEFVGRNIEKFTVGIVFLSILPILFHWLQERKTHSNALLSATTTIAEEK